MWRHTMALFHSPRFDIVRRRRCISWKTLDHGQPHDITLDCIAHNVQIIKCTKEVELYKFEPWSKILLCLATNWLSWFRMTIYNCTWIFQICSNGIIVCL